MLLKPLLALFLAAAAVWTPSAVAADAGRGKLDYGMCFGCHAIGPHARVKVGPPLNGVVGQRWATYRGYDYSPGLRAGGAAGKTWTVATLNDWLKGPRDMVPSTKMGFAGMTNTRDRADVIAYLDQFDASGHKK
ncbi:c-type cytochrome [Acidisoma cladoniae]|jgi:cytochrome c|uniref:c-type cytochrome n=1 Tax=Acidisoma cladoniae TaxID=3040935 RepID=UPI00254C70A6|nr:cytochrome c family protein [Acidisoma sp. PAMC 29798]